MLLFLAACSVDNNLNPDDKPSDGFDSGDDFDPGIDSDSGTVPDEECNGVDDNGDGLVDEGYPDDNANGRADCLDETCPALDLGTAGSVAIPEECMGTTGGGGTEVADAWNVKVKWTFKAPSISPGGTNSYSAPVIGNLDDDNGDGKVDDNDSPEVVITTFGGTPTITAVDGATGIEKWSYATNVSYQAGTTIADVDNDGWPDVVSGVSGAKTIVLNGDGTEKWTATDLASAMGYVMHNVADLDEDGHVEIVHDDLVLDGETGAKLFKLNVGTSDAPYRLAAVGDVDNDGDQEIAMAGRLFDSDGSLLWDSGERGVYGFWPVIIQADSDADAEIGFVGNNWSLFEADGSNLYTVKYGTTAHPGPPCAGDFDGDGITEVAWPSYQTFVMYELDGTQVWSVPMDDTSGLAGCSGYDLNNDGALEILFADQTTFTIFDGKTGAELYVDPSHRSGTVFEYPTVADLDADGHSEIVIVNNGGGPGVLVAYEHNGSGWPAAGSTWAVHDFAITNINADGSVPTHPDPYWTKYNVYRARVAADDPSMPDITVAITDQCIADCDFGPVTVGVQVGNAGGADIDAGRVLNLYADDDAGERLVASHTLPLIPAGTLLDGVEFNLTPADIGRYGWIARVDEDEVLNECNETNNEDRWTDSVCF